MRWCILNEGYGGSACTLAIAALASGCDQQPEAGQVLGAHNRPTGSAPHDLSVTEIDKKVVGDGATGDLTRRLIQLYDEEVKKGEPVNVE